MYTVVDKTQPKSLLDLKKANPVIFSIDEVLSRDATYQKVCSELLEGLAASYDEDGRLKEAAQDMSVLPGIGRNLRKAAKAALLDYVGGESESLWSRFRNAWFDMTHSEALLEMVEAFDLAQKQGAISFDLSELIDHLEPNAVKPELNVLKTFEAAFVFAMCVAAWHIRLRVVSGCNFGESKCMEEQRRLFIEDGGGVEKFLFDADGRSWEKFSALVRQIQDNEDENPLFQRHLVERSSQYQRFVFAALGSKLNARLQRANTLRNKMIGFIATFAMVFLSFLKDALKPILFDPPAAAFEDEMHQLGFNISLT